MAETGNGKGTLKPDRWQRVRELFDAALEMELPNRVAFFEKECAGDEALRREVETLLSSHDNAEAFLERPAYEAAAALFESESLVGQRIGPYLVAQKIGEGGMGVVYLAEDSRLDRAVAIKALPPHRTRDPQYRERLRREAKAAAKLSDPGIATVFSLEEDGDNLYIVREYIRGRTLAEELQKGALAPSVVVDIATRITRALVSAHEAGVVHRDLKPENVIRMPDGGIKILDFGLARLVGSGQNDTHSVARLTSTGMLVGTPAYASPEQLKGADIDHRTDVFSLGVVLFELATGIHPFSASDPLSLIARILEVEPPDFRQLSPASPLQLDLVLRKCLRKQPSERYQSARELLYDLEQIASNVPLQAHVPGVQMHPPEPVAKSNPARSMFWWWQIHQGGVGVLYYLMVYPMWRVKEWMSAGGAGIQGSLLFFPALIAVGISANLRFHLWFTSSFDPDQLDYQRRRTAAWIRFGDILFVFMLLTTAAIIHTMHAVVASILVTAAVYSLVAFLLIEPTTARAMERKGDKGAKG
jgi:serine/threonine protein kinase